MAAIHQIQDIFPIYIMEITDVSPKLEAKNLIISSFKNIKELKSSSNKNISYDDLWNNNIITTNISKPAIYGISGEIEGMNKDDYNLFHKLVKENK